MLKHDSWEGGAALQRLPNLWNYRSKNVSMLADQLFALCFLKTVSHQALVQLLTHVQSRHDALELIEPILLKYN